MQRRADTPGRTLNVSMATLAEIRRAGLAALAAALGPVGVARFLRMNEEGQGDHPAEQETRAAAPATNERLDALDTANAVLGDSRRTAAHTGGPGRGGPVMTAGAVREVGIESLTLTLGPVGMIRFLQQFETGHGDYTAERQRREVPGTPGKVVALAEEIIREQEARRLGPPSASSLDR